MKQHLQTAMNIRQTAPTTRAREDQVKNSAGGYVFQVSDLDAVKRFLILGTEGGSYYASEKDLTLAMATRSIGTIKSKGVEVVDLIVSISDGGRAYKNSSALFLLAAASAVGDLQTRRAALNALPKVARTATHLFEFLEYTKQFRGWGRGLKTAVQNWYEQKGAGELAYQMVKYRNRNGWTHRDVLRKAHPAGATMAHKALYDWACHDVAPSEHTPGIVADFLKAIKSTSEKEVIELIKSNPALPWEALSTQMLASKEVWKALLPKLPMTALVRNLGRMTANGTLSIFSDEVSTVCDRITDKTALHRARVHPLSLFVAKRTYDAGSGDKGSLRWNPDGKISAALEEAFYESFNYVEPTGKRILIGMDVSGSMGWGQCSGVKNLTPAEGSALMALTILKSEQNVHTFAFADTFKKLNLSAKDNFESAMRKTSGINFGGTDCSLPMVYALQHKIPVDAFIVFTDNETWAGRMQPFQALQKYRREMGINAKLIVVAMVGNDFTIADPSDPGMLDVVGFDTNTPAAIASFIAM